MGKIFFRRFIEEIGSQELVHTFHNIERHRVPKPIGHNRPTKTRLSPYDKDIETLAVYPAPIRPAFARQPVPPVMPVPPAMHPSFMPPPNLQPPLPPPVTLFNGFPNLFNMANQKIEPLNTGPYNGPTGFVPNPPRAPLLQPVMRPPTVPIFAIDINLVNNLYMHYLRTAFCK